MSWNKIYKEQKQKNTKVLLNCIVWYMQSKKSTLWNLYIIYLIKYYLIYFLKNIYVLNKKLFIS